MKKQEMLESAKKAREEYLAKLNETLIYKNGDAFAFGSSAFYAGGLDNLVPFNKNFFKWNVAENESEFMGETVYCLTLGELKEQLAASGYDGLLTLFVNRPMNGEIYQFGNYSDGEWCELGTLKGFC